MTGPKAHPLNTGFRWQMPSDHTLPNDVSPDDVAAFDRDGYYLARNVFSTNEIAEVAAAIDPFEEQTTAFLRTRPDGKMFIADAEAITFTVHLVVKSELLRRFACHPRLASIVHTLVGENARLYWDQAVYKKPEPEREFPWHQDNGYAFVEPQQYLTCWIPLTPVTVDNGCPWIIPGAHRDGTIEHAMTPVGWECPVDRERAVAVEAMPGDVVVFSSLTPHRTGPNVTNAVRKAYILQYAPDGACVVRARDDGEVERIPQDDPTRQFFVASHE